MRRLRRARPLVSVVRGQGGRLGLRSCLLPADRTAYSWVFPGSCCPMLIPPLHLSFVYQLYTLQGVINCPVSMRKLTLVTPGTQVPAHSGFGWWVLISAHLPARQPSSSPVLVATDPPATPSSLLLLLPSCCDLAPLFTLASKAAGGMNK